MSNNVAESRDIIAHAGDKRVRLL